MRLQGNRRRKPVLGDMTDIETLHAVSFRYSRPSLALGFDYSEHPLAAHIYPGHKSAIRLPRQPLVCDDPALDRRRHGFE